jgi:hypothetical protein
LCHPQVGRRGPRAAPTNASIRDRTYVRVSWHEVCRAGTC